MVFQDRFPVPVFVQFLTRLFKSVRRRIFLILDGHLVHRAAVLTLFVSLWGQVLLLSSRHIGYSADGSVMQPYPIRNLSLAVPVPMDRLPNRGIALDLGVLPIKQLLEWRSAQIPLTARDLRNLLVALYIPLELLDKVLFSQQDLCTQAFPDRRPAEPFSNKSPVVNGGLMPLLPKLTEDPVHGQPGGTCGEARRRPVAAPLPLLHFLHGLSPNRIQHHVATNFLKVALSVSRWPCIGPGIDGLQLGAAGCSVEYRCR